MIKSSRRKDFLAFVPLIPVFFLIAEISNLQKALVSVVAIYTFYVLISEKWSNKGRVGFWIIVGLFAVIHAIAIYSVTLESRISPAMIFLPLSVVDFFAMYYAIGLYEKLRVGHDKAS